MPLADKLTARASDRDGNPLRNTKDGVSFNLLSSALPFETLVQTARYSWHTGWRVMMSQLAPSSSSGDYVRPKAAFESTSTRPTSTDARDYRLYFGMACPWCHRATLARTLYGLEGVLPLTLCEPNNAGKWVLRDGDESRRQPQPRDLKSVYKALAPAYRGRATAPLLVAVSARAVAGVGGDRRGAGAPAHALSNMMVVSNESVDIVRFLRTLAHVDDNGNGNEDAAAGRGAQGRSVPDLYPERHRAQIDADCAWLHTTLNNGVYRAGFATSQAAYERAVVDVFSTLDALEQRLRTQRYVSGTPDVSESDVYLFPTLIRFDTVYHILFRCSRRRVASDYPSLHAWLREMWQRGSPSSSVNGGGGDGRDGVRGTCDVRGVAESYFRQLFPLNPSGIVADADAGDLDAPHGREVLA